MTREESKEAAMGALNAATESARTARKAGAESDALRLLLWSCAALVEMLVLGGGLMWILSGPGAIQTPARIALVALAAVSGGGAFALAAAKKSS
jgi:hypothetical protein